MSPECIVGHIYNQSADCYSWAMVFYEMLSLQKPFASYNREVHRIVVCEHHERPCVSSTEENIPPDARRLLQHAWAQDPVDRPSMQELCDDDLKPMIERAQRLLLTPTERSSAAIMEMSELFGGITDVPIETKSSSSTTKSSWFPLRSLLSSGLEHQKRDRNQKLSRRLSTADMTVSTALTSTSRSSTSSSTPITSAGGSCGGGSGINNDHDPHVQFLNVGAPTGMIAFPGISCWLDM
jgi:serine/threonine protein kinase